MLCTRCGEREAERVIYVEATPAGRPPRSSPEERRAREEELNGLCERCLIEVMVPPERRAFTQQVWEEQRAMSAAAAATPVSAALPPLLVALEAETTRDPSDVVLLRKRLTKLLQFLVSPEERTLANFYATMQQLDLANWTGFSRDSKPKRDLVNGRPIPMKLIAMNRRILKQSLVASALVLAAATRLSAQTIGGEVAEAMTAQPLRGYQVRLFYLAQGDSTHARDSTTTDERGLFQFGGQGTGAYRLEFGPPDSRLTSSARVEATTPDTSIAIRFRVPLLELSGAQAFAAKDVQQVAIAYNGHGPRYPEDLRTMSVTGEVVVRFVVDSTGSVRPGSLTVLRSSHPGFTKAVADFMRTAKFHPARVGGIAVAQLVQEPFTFSLARM